MKPSKDTQKPQQTPFEAAEESRTKRNMLTVSYMLTLQVIAEAYKTSGRVDNHALEVLVAIANETEKRLGISA